MAEKRKNIIVRRTAQVLKCFAQKPNGWGITELASHLGLAKSVVFEILSTLVDEGLVKKDEKEKTYLCGNELLKLALTHFSNIDLIKISRPVLKNLAKEIRETVLLSQVIENRNVVIENIEGTEPLRYAVDIGTSLPLDKGSSAKVNLAFLPEEKKKEIINIYKVDMNKLKEELKMVKKRGFAISKEEVSLGINAISSPIFNKYNELEATIILAGPTLRYNKGDKQSIHELISKIISCAKEISTQIGFSLNWKWS